MTGMVSAAETCRAPRGGNNSPGDGHKFDCPQTLLCPLPDIVPCYCHKVARQKLVFQSLRVLLLLAQPVLRFVACPASPVPSLAVSERGRRSTKELGYASGSCPDGLTRVGDRAEQSPVCQRRTSTGTRTQPWWQLGRERAGAFCTTGPGSRVIPWNVETVPGWVATADRVFQERAKRWPAPDRASPERWPAPDRASPERWPAPDRASPERWRGRLAAKSSRHRGSNQSWSQPCHGSAFVRSSHNVDDWTQWHSASSGTCSEPRHDRVVGGGCCHDGGEQAQPQSHRHSAATGHIRSVTRAV